MATNSKDDMIRFSAHEEESARPKGNPNLTLNKIPTSLSRSAEDLKSTSFIDSFGSPLSCHAIRLRPGQELRKALMDFVTARRLKAAFIMTCVGSAKCAKLRLANAVAGDTNYLLDLQGPLEIISVNGTFGMNGQCHLHASVANAAGKMHGGHLIELIVHTTAEVIIGECNAMVFQRVFDKNTGFTELVVEER